MNKDREEYIMVVNLVKPTTITTEQAEKLAKAVIMAAKFKIPIPTFKSEVQRFLGRSN